MREKTVWIDGREHGIKEGAERLSSLFGERIPVDWLASLLKCRERCTVRGVEIAFYPTASWEDRELGRAAAPPPARPEKRRPLLNRRALGFGLPHPGWFA
jgi:hypothetical protein